MAEPIDDLTTVDILVQRHLAHENAEDQRDDRTSVDEGPACSFERPVGQQSPDESHDDEDTECDIGYLKATCQQSLRFSSGPYSRLLICGTVKVTPGT